MIALRGAAFGCRPASTAIPMHLRDRHHVNAQAKLALEDLPRRFESLVERIPGIVAYMDLVDRDDPGHSTPLYISPQIEELMGYPREAWLSDDELWLRVLHPEDSERMVHEDARARGTLSSLLAEYRMIARDGRVVWVSEKAAVLEDEISGLTYWQGVMVDMTERKRAEEGLAASERQFRSIFDAASIGVMTLGLDGRILEANPMLEQVCDYPSEALKGQPLEGYLEADDSVGLELDQLVAGDRDRCRVEHRFRRRDQSLMWCRTVMALVRDAAHRPAHVIAMLEDISDRKQAEVDLLHRTLHDSLTELPNRICFHDAVTQAIGAAREGGELAILLIDLDRFKEVNDTLGHHYGDRLLREFAAALSRHLRPPDTVARLGGDEFGVLLQVDGDATAAAKSAVARIENLLATPYQVEGLPLSVEASIGIARFPQDGDDVTKLLQHADIAMYVAKASGTGHAFYEASGDDHDRRRLGLLGELRRAISEHELVLHYQPKLDLRTKRIDRVEALVRWQHPALGLLPPAEFIPLAEQTGLINPLTLYVLDEALDQCRRWLAEGKEISVSVNVSPRSLNDSAFPDAVAQRLRNHQVPAQSLLLEVTESAIIFDPVRAEETLRTLSRLGVRLALDDFGTGHSSLTLLGRLPLDQIKIDRSFVTNLTTNAGNDVIVRAIINLGHQLGLEVVGEGVETIDVTARLQQYGCDILQGYTLTPPLPAKELEHWLEEQRITQVSKAS
jgi:diguanylate cyclase (GGDEF)-like protein/PAS domain S-box-containing protein